MNSEAVDKGHIVQTIALESTSMVSIVTEQRSWRATSQCDGKGQVREVVGWHGTSCVIGEQRPQGPDIAA